MNEAELKQQIKQMIEFSKADKEDKENPFKMNQTITFKVPPIDYEYLKERADKEGWTVSKLIRYCLFIEGITVCTK